MGVDKQGPLLRADNEVQQKELLASTAQVPQIAGFKIMEEEVPQKPAELLIRVSTLSDIDDRFEGFRVTNHHRAARLVVIANEGGFSAADLDRLERSASLSFAEPNYLYPLIEATDSPLLSLSSSTTNRVPNDPWYTSDTQWNLDYMGFSALWPIKLERKVIVAVLDSGVDESHEDLRGRVIRGFNVLTKTTSVEDKIGHGTHCAGIIAAISDNGTGVAGIANNVQILPVKLFDKGSAGPTAMEIVKAIDFAVESGAHIINASWGGPDLADGLSDAVDRAAAKGVLIVAAAGNARSNNDGAPIYPASLRRPNVISVMALNQQGRRHDTSNYGKKSVDIAAPGRLIVSTIPNSYGSKNGTSMAAPHVTAVLAAIIGTVEAAPSTPIGFAARAALFNMAKKSASLANLCASGAYVYYDPKKLSVATSTVTVSGTLQAGTVGLGGETTGVLLLADGKRYEIEGSSKQISDAFRKSSGQHVIVSGSMEQREGEARPDRTVLRVETAQRALRN